MERTMSQAKSTISSLVAEALASMSSKAPKNPVAPVLPFEPKFRHPLAATFHKSLRGAMLTGSVEDVRSVIGTVTAAAKISVFAKDELHFVASIGRHFLRGIEREDAAVREYESGAFVVKMKHAILAVLFVLIAAGSARAQNGMYCHTYTTSSNDTTTTLCHIQVEGKDTYTVADSGTDSDSVEQITKKRYDTLTKQAKQTEQFLAYAYAQQRKQQQEKAEREAEQTPPAPPF
jgi:hypothetical protein